MAKANKKGKYDLTIKSKLDPDELFKKAINTPPKKNKAAYKPKQKP